jgi:monoamine oxidase
MAGLTAARALLERGLKVIVLEAKPHVGGRVLSRTVEGGQAVELGAEFIHGRAPELWALIEEAGLETTERSGSMLRETAPGKLEADRDEDEDPFEPLEQLEGFEGEDVPFADWLAASDVPGWQRDALTGYVEGFNAADAKRIGIASLGAQQKAEDASEGDRAWHIRGGYAQLAAYLEARVKELGGDVRLSCEALAIRWRTGSVEIETNRCGPLFAPRCIVTLPLSVLQKTNEEGGVRMAPEPKAVAHARRLAMGTAVRFTMVFREAWWLQSKAADADDLANMHFVLTQPGPPAVWWTQHPEHEEFPTLTGWAGGPRAEALVGKSAGELGHVACTTLANVFGIDEELIRASLMATYTHDWSSDAFACGAYSYVPAGAVDAPVAMTEPVVDTLFFAGEHTDVTANWGTVHAAIRSGLRVTQQILGESA